MSTNQRPAPRIAAVVVTFNADIDRLRTLLEAASPQVEHIYVVDNGDGKAVRTLVDVCAGTTLLVMGRNLGIAAAQNAGARAAMKAGAEFILLLDQDSVPAPDMAIILWNAFRQLSEKGHQMAAVGPRAPSREDPGTFVIFSWFRYRKVVAQAGESCIFCDMLIASGVLISVQAFCNIGPMDEALFIDKVDTEWCIRAASRGYKLAGVPAAVLSHSLGESSLRVWWGGWKHVATHRPFRYYYIVRNSALLTRRHYVGWRWRTADFKQTVQILVFFGIFSPVRWQILHMVVRGFWAGLQGRGGPMPGTW